MSAWTAAAVADRRRDLADPSARPGDQFARAVTYVLAAQQSPALVLAGSWVVSLFRDGVTAGQVRAALAAALTGPVVGCPHCRDGFTLDDLADGDVLGLCAMCVRTKAKSPTGLTMQPLTPYPPAPTPEAR